MSRARLVISLRMLACSALCFSSIITARAGEAVTLERSATLAELFPAEQVRALADTLPADAPVLFHLRIPAGEPGEKLGAMIFVKADDSGEFIGEWALEFDHRHLLWISADGFSNRKPTAQRVLSAMMARELIERVAAIDEERVYLAGMSGGGRVASQTITRFPQKFSGALYVVGADFHLPEGGADSPLIARVLDRRYVFLTGSKDFNRREMRLVSKRYRDAGASRVLLIDEPGFAHQHATAPLLARALEFLDAR